MTRKRYTSFHEILDDVDYGVVPDVAGVPEIAVGHSIRHVEMDGGVPVTVVTDGPDHLGHRQPCHYVDALEHEAATVCTMCESVKFPAEPLFSGGDGSGA